ncbi:MAG: LacI family DNA-binding transcriptional regulator [Planctomycetota bacterium]
MFINRFISRVRSPVSRLSLLAPKPLPVTQLKAPTLTEVSRLAGCSKAAASAVLNGSRGNISVSDALRQRVQDIARELNYRPNYASRSLALRRTQALGIYIPRGPWSGIGSNYEGHVLHGIELACVARKYNLSVINMNGNEPPQRCLDTLVEQRVDGLLVLRVDGDESWLAELLERRDAVVAIDCHRPLPGLDAVMFNHDDAIGKAVDHLVGLGHRRIGYLGTCCHQTVPHNELRREAYVKAIVRNGLQLDPALIFGPEQSPVSVERGNQHLQLAGEYGAGYFVSMGAARPTAIVAYEDLSATTAIRFLADHGLSVPRDISLVNIEDSRLSRQFMPRLTTVMHPVKEMGQRAAELLIDRASTTSGQAARAGVHESFDAELMVRESTAPPSAPTGVTP